MKAPRLAGLLVALLAAPGRPASAEEAAAAVRQVLEDQVAAWNRGDLDGYMQGYWRSPELVFQSGDSVVKGWQATLDRYKKRYQGEGREMGRLSFRELEISVLAPDAAFVRGAWQLEMKDGTQPRGLFTLLVRKKDGAWRIVHDHTS